MGIGSDARTSAPIEVPAGSTAVAVLDGVDATQRTHVRPSWTADRAAGFIGQQSGCFDAHTGVWTADWRIDGAHAEVVHDAPTDPTPVTTLHLAFERDASNLTVLVDDARASANVTASIVREATT